MAGSGASAGRASAQRRRGASTTTTRRTTIYFAPRSSKEPGLRRAIDSAMKGRNSEKEI